MILCGGSAVPQSLSEAYRDALGFPILHAWGMTETSPIATISSPRSYYADLDEGQRADARARQGQPVPLVDLRIVDPGSGEAQPWDDTAPARCRPRARGSRRSTTAARAAARSSPTTAGCAPATSRPSTGTAASGSSTARRT